MNHTNQYAENEVIQITNQIIQDAIAKRASDIHFEPYQALYRIRIRVDGVLQMIRTLSVTLAKQVTVRIKIMANLNIAEQRLPQDGQLAIGNLTMRISTLPILYGEKIVLRIMDNSQHGLSLDQIGLDPQQLNDYKTLLDSPQGLILITGPTGSGKTITLYSGLNYVDSSQRNVCSVEDPIEIPLVGINQTQVNIKAGLDFTSVLRALLRQDPDIIMIGEIRDQITAEIAIQAAQTGHLVLSTLHTNSTAETLVRLSQMGIKTYLIAACLKLVIAQRLIRKLCPHCKIIATDPLIIEEDGQTNQYSQYIAKGCEHCLGGYYERIGIYEFLIITPEISSLLLASDQFSLNQIQQLIIQQQIITLSISALNLVKNGITSLAEVQRVLGENNY